MNDSNSNSHNIIRPKWKTENMKELVDLIKPLKNNAVRCSVCGTTFNSNNSEYYCYKDMCPSKVTIATPC